MVGHLRWEWAWGLKIASAPPCAMTPTQHISYFCVASALIVKNVRLVRSGAGRFKSSVCYCQCCTQNMVSSFGLLKFKKDVEMQKRIQ